MGVIAITFCIVYGGLSIIAGIRNSPRDFWLGQYHKKNEHQAMKRFRNIFWGISVLALGLGILYYKIMVK
jgi:hypothetical protein